MTKSIIITISLIFIGPLLLKPAYCANANLNTEDNRSASQRGINSTYFVSELLEGEGPYIFKVKKTPLELHEEPSRQSQSFLTNEINNGQRLNFDQARLVVLSPGIISANTDGGFDGRRLGTINYLSRNLYYSDVPTEPINYKRGEKFEYLQYRAEGYCIIRRNGIVYEIPVPWSVLGDKGSLYLSHKETTESWIRVVNMSKKPLGWLLINSPNINIEP